MDHLNTKLVAIQMPTVPIFGLSTRDFIQLMQCSEARFITYIIFFGIFDPKKNLFVLVEKMHFADLSELQLLVLEILINRCKNNAAALLTPC